MSETRLDLLLGRSWHQEVIHQLVLRELLRETTLGRALSIWSDEVLRQCSTSLSQGASTIQRPVGGPAGQRGHRAGDQLRAAVEVHKLRVSVPASSTPCRV